MTTETRHAQPNPTPLPTDPFDLALSNLIGLPNGAHTQPAIKQAQDFYGNVTQYITQTVRHDKGDTVFLTVVTANGQPGRFILPPEILALIDRQRGAVATTVKRRHGKRLAAERKAAGHVPSFTPEQRAKGLATRKRKAAARQRRAAK